MQHAQHRQPVRRASGCNSRMISSRRFGIEAGHRLVRQQHPRPLRQRTRDRDTLRLAARQRAGALSGKIGEADFRQMAAWPLEFLARGRPPSAVHNV